MSKVNAHVDGEGFTMTQPGGVGAPPPYGAPPGNRNFPSQPYLKSVLFTQDAFLNNVPSSDNITSM